jgi:NAD(P)H-hydrate repair Nnr-like enzyme with NAD(P)H-hydrate epimerase domain
MVASVDYPRSSLVIGLGANGGSGFSAAETLSDSSFAAANSRILLTRLLHTG